MAASGERSRSGRADEPAEGTRWNQMELLTTFFRYFLVNRRIDTNANSVGYPRLHARFDRLPRPLLRPHESSHDLLSKCSLPNRTRAFGRERARSGQTVSNRTVASFVREAPTHAGPRLVCGVRSREGGPDAP